MVKNKKTVWQYIWSWEVIGFILALIYGGGLGFTASQYSLYIADSFFIAGGLLFLFKFLTWEISRTKNKKKIFYTLSATFIFLVISIAVWGNHLLHFQKVTLTVSPPITNIKASINCGPDHIPGAWINGIEWQKKYHEYFLIIINENENTTISNFRAYIDLPWAIIKYEIKDKRGIQELNLSQEEVNFSVSKDWVVKENIDQCNNTMIIDAIKLFPQGYLEISIIAWTDISPLIDDGYSGSINLKYNYTENASPVSICYPIKHHNGRKNLFVDKDNPFSTGESFRGHIFFLKRDDILNPNIMKSIAVYEIGRTIIVGVDGINPDKPYLRFYYPPVPKRDDN